MLELFMCLMLELLKLLLNFYSLGVTFFLLKFVISKFFEFLFFIYIIH
jgi:hypothetical protein